VKLLPFQYNDPQANGPQYLEDIATAYWYSETLFTAVDMEIFTLLEPEGKNLAEIAEASGVAPAGLERFLQALCALGLLERCGEVYFNTRVAREFLVKGKEHYQGSSIMWRRYLVPNWRSLRRCLKQGGRVRFARRDAGAARMVQRTRRYAQAMDSVAKIKIKEILPFFADLVLTGEILDVGSGLGALSAGLLEHYPAARATLLDIPEVLACTQEIVAKTELRERVAYCPANILEPWPLEQGRFDLVILSNIVHAYADAEIAEVLGRAAASLRPGGLLLVHDFFREHSPEKAALFDLNMFVNTFNGKVYDAAWVREQLELSNLCVGELVPLESDTALLFAAKEAGRLQNICWDRRSQLMARIKRLGFSGVRPISVDDIKIPGWVGLRCRYGCDNFGKPHCSPDSLTPERTKEMLGDFRYGLLLEGTPPTRDFQRCVLEAEKEAFKAGYYKAFALWAGPCALCAACAGEDGCRNQKEARPSLEGAGIDVFATARGAGITLRTLADTSDYAKYFAILLLE